MRRSPSEKYVSIWRYDPSCSPPASRARAFPRSSYRAFSSTRCFEPLPTTSGIPCACKKLPSRRQRGNPAPCLSPKTEMGGDRKADDRMTRSSMSSRRAGRTAAHAIATLVGLLLVVPGLYIASARDPRSGDAFEYGHNIYLDRGTGEYDGYSETTRAHSTYRVLSTSGDKSTVLAQGSWSWQASDGNRQSGILDVQFSFSVTTRRYLAGIDVEGNYSDPAVWFWISTPAVPGQVHHILDDSLTVTSVDATVWIGSLPRKALQLDSSRTYFRDDVYGQFTVSYHDRYYFDANTGFILSESYEEIDQSGLASFRWREEIVVTASSYPIPLDLVSFGAIFVGIPAVLVATLYGVRRYYRGPRTVIGRTETGMRAVTVRRVPRPAAPLDVAPRAPKVL